MNEFQRSDDELGGLTPEQYAAVKMATTDVARKPGFLVILARQIEMPSQEIIVAFAQGIASDPFSARQKLLSPTPRILRREETQEKADRWASWLMALGIPGFVLPEEVAATCLPTPVDSIFFDDTRIWVESDKTERMEVANNDLLAVVFGRLTARQRKDSITKDFIFGDIQSNSETLRVQSECVLDIHRRSTPGFLRLRQNDAKFNRMFPGEQTASDVQIKKLIAMLEPMVGKNRVYDDFLKVSAIMGESWSVISHSNYLAYKMFRPGLNVKWNSSKVTQSNDEAAFNLYSILNRFQAIRGF